MFQQSPLLHVLLCCLPLAAVTLRCYTCVFPAISPIECMPFPQECPAGQRCLSSTAVAVKGAIRLVVYEKGCAVETHCGLTGQKAAAGLSFNYTNNCCDTDLCNHAPRGSAPCGAGLVLSLLPLLLMGALR
ncbi:protein Bouncer-like [Denticeps clupeoides]|uniref:UPAR/Ly6 domain-containing protein n=1 Tax=Denticeps clupeoides TaxID=299321 RepID=A0AAY4BPV3_9TELE|nr:protein Bouncer-like [Denticeps clupeoides]